VRTTQPTIQYSLLIAIVCLAIGASPVCQAKSPKASRVNVHLVTDEAEAVLAILAKRSANEPVMEADWQRLFAAEGYVRLKKREAKIKEMYPEAAPFDDTIFKKFVLSDQLLGRTKALEETLRKWKQADTTVAARRALAYLPKEAGIRAKVYPVIKPGTNSFVFEITTDPAIFLYLDPDVSKEKFENTLAHELHHIGYGSACPGKQTSAEISRLPANAQRVIQLIGAFGEGLAMLAAAGGPDIHPHAVSSAKDRARWDRDMDNFNTDLKKVETFLLDVLDKRLSEEKQDEISGSFYGVQGPWYTVGWKMAVTIEKRFGRTELIRCMCDQRKLLATYNRAAAKYRAHKEQLALWSDRLIKGIEHPGS
jgi:hypothetical protein